jgi:hypothetical protein
MQEPTQGQITKEDMKQIKQLTEELQTIQTPHKCHTIALRSMFC